MLFIVTTIVNIILLCACVGTGHGLDSVLTLLRLYLQVLDESLNILKDCCFYMCIVVFTESIYMETLNIGRICIIHILV